MFYFHYAKLFCYLSTFYFHPCRKSAAFRKLIFFLQCLCRLSYQDEFGKASHTAPHFPYSKTAFIGVFWSHGVRGKKNTLQVPASSPRSVLTLTHSRSVESQASLSSRSVIQPPWLPFHSLASFQP